MTEPVRLLFAAWALVDGTERPAVGDVVTIAIRRPFAFELCAEVIAYEGDAGREEAILVDQLGCRWAMPVPPAATSVAAA